jgi:hypothetical protein
MRYIQVALFVFCLFVAQKALAVVEISDGSVSALYHFENDDVDSSGYGRNRTPGSTSTYAAGKVGTYSWDTTNLLNYSDSVSSTLWGAGDYSLGMWIQPQDELETGDGVYFFFNGVTSNYNFSMGYGILCVLDYMEFVQKTPCQAVAYDFNAGNWYWLLYTRQGTVGNLYVNNTLISSVTNSQTLTPNNVWGLNGEIFSRTGRRDLWFDELFATTNAINTSTRDAIYNSGTGAEICTSSGCASGGGGGTDPSNDVQIVKVQTVVDIAFWVINKVIT